MPVGVAETRLEHRRPARLDRDPQGPEYTPEETAAKERNHAMWREIDDAEIDDAEIAGTEIAGTDHPWTEGSPVPMLPVAQLHLRDIPLLRPPGRADLLQVLAPTTCSSTSAGIPGASAHRSDPVSCR